MSETKMSATITLKNFFGFLPGQGLMDFNNELKALSADAKAELAGLAKAEFIRTGQYSAESFAF